MSIAFKDHFSAVAADYANARPEYPDALYAWVAQAAPARERAWEAGCGSGQATRGLALYFDEVFATDPSAAQVALPTAAFVERCQTALHGCLAQPVDGGLPGFANHELCKKAIEA